MCLTSCGGSLGVGNAKISGPGQKSFKRRRALRSRYGVASRLVLVLPTCSTLPGRQSLVEHILCFSFRALKSGLLGWLNADLPGLSSPRLLVSIP